MPKFIIEPHFRLQEWVAEEKGYFRDEGLDYIFRELVQSSDGQQHNTATKVGAYQSIEAGARRTSAAPATGPSGSPRRQVTANCSANSIPSVRPASSSRLNSG